MVRSRLWALPGSGVTGGRRHFPDTRSAVSTRHQHDAVLGRRGTGCLGCSVLVTFLTLGFCPWKSSRFASALSWGMFVLVGI